MHSIKVVARRSRAWEAASFAEPDFAKCAAGTGEISVGSSNRLPFAAEQTVP